jgi:hypothetical protein
VHDAPDEFFLEIPMVVDDLAGPVLNEHGPGKWARGWSSPMIARPQSTSRPTLPRKVEV